ncbi:thiamine biosynthesis protein ThiS [Fervidicella metallireducens AeB]|uniref:Thiamine biosynthesis protein ThiS n=1 Tax=Fervidicella metallireducens AeB TaxID=1403537 RepID=A0A017RRP5_9CLOT|nr:sulfur carrier protein ThiS [Fervidicella metallireducens]EYE87327.1 thiamine biosynthesis protein ThiS [Fervidicella metallireducens AeB]
MIKLNGREFQWNGSLTVKEILEINKFLYPKIIVMVNDEFIPPEEYETTSINDGDDVKIIHLLAGG